MKSVLKSPEITKFQPSIKHSLTAYSSPPIGEDPERVIFYVKIPINDVGTIVLEQSIIIDNNELVEGRG